MWLKVHHKHVVHILDSMSANTQFSPLPLQDLKIGGLEDGLGLDVEQKGYKQERMNTCVLLQKKYLGEKSIDIEQFVQ